MVLDSSALIDLAANREAIRAMPPAAGVDHVITLLQLAAGHQYGGRTDAAIRLYRKVLLLEPANHDALHLLAVCEHTQGNEEHAAALLKQSIALQPDGQKWSNLGIIEAAAGNVHGAVKAHRQALWTDPTAYATFTNLIFAIDNHPLSTPRLLLDERRRFNAYYCAELTAQAPPHTNSLDPNRKLRLGYVSGDFKTHSASRAFAPFVMEHDLRKFDVYLYSNNAKTPEEEPDRLTEAFMEKARSGGYVWSQITGYSDEMLAQVIRDDQIDILVDLSGYSAQGRLLTFARKPAPVQITGWGYATGTGLDAMDYLVGDPICVPPENERFYHEKIIRLPVLLCYQFADRMPEIGPIPCPQKGHLTFGYIGRGIKINEAVIAAWAEILRRVPDSSLLLKGDEYRQPFFRERVMDMLVAMGVDPRRVKILVATTSYDHISTYNLIDIALDTWPVGSGVTALDAVAMGVPVVTMLGDLIPSRLPTSIMTTVGLDRQNTTIEEYVEHAVELSENLPLLSEYRQTLRGKLQGSIIMDGETYCRRWEAQLREVWRGHCAEQKKVRAA